MVALYAGRLSDNGHSISSSFTMLNVSCYQLHGGGSFEGKIQELEREKQAQATVTTKSKHDIEALTLKVNEDLDREVAELRRQHDQDKASLELLHQYVRVFPIELVITNFTERKSSNRAWYS